MEKKTTLILVGAILAIALLIFAMPQRTIVLSDTQNQAVTVSSLAQLLVEPDEVSIQIGVETEAQTALEAQQENARISQRVYDALLKQGLNESQIETAYYYVNQQTQYNQDTRRMESTGFRVTNVLRITTNDVDGLGRLVDAAVSSGANNINSITFGLSDETERNVQREAIEKASELARQKAEDIARPLQVRVGEVVSVLESNFYATPFEFTTAQTLRSNEATRIIAPDSIEVTASLVVSFRII